MAQSNRVERKDVVSLNGRLFWVSGGVRRQIANQFAQKTVIGEFNETSDPVLSQITWNDLRGGQGRYIIRPNELDEGHLSEFWEGPTRNDILGHILPPPSDINLSQIFDSAGETDSSAFITSLMWAKEGSATSEKLHFTATNDSAIHLLNAIAGNSNTFLQNLASKPLELKSGPVNGMQTFAVAESTSFEWGHSSDDLSNSGNWNTDSSQLMKSIEFWRDLLWGVSDSGELFFTGETTSTSALNWVSVANTHTISSNTIRSLKTGSMAIPGSDDREHLFLVRNDGFDIYDRLTEKFTPAMRLPSSTNAGLGFHVWNGAAYYSYGLSLYQWAPTPNGNVVTDIGLGQKEGMSPKFVGDIYSVNASPRQLFATVTALNDSVNGLGVDALYARSADAGWTQVDNGVTSSRKVTTDMYVGPWLSGSSLAMVAISGIKTSPQSYRAVKLKIGNEVVNNDSAANVIQAINGSDSDYVIGPWIIADGNQDWTAYKLSAEVSFLTGQQAFSNNSVYFALDYATDFNDSEWTRAIYVVSDSTMSEFPEGRFEAPLPNATNPEGVPFTALRWRFNILSRNHNFYDLHRLSLVFQKRPKLRYAFTFDIDYSKDSPQGYTPKEQREFLDEYYMQTTLAPFGYHDELPGGGQTYYVTPLQPTAQEETGNPEAGQVRMTVMEAASQQ